MISDWKKEYNKKYYKENKEAIKQLSSNNLIYRNLDNKIRYLDKKIAKSRAEKKTLLRKKEDLWFLKEMN